MTTLGGVFLIAHGLLHLAVWVAPQRPDAPFDAGHSWLLGDAGALSRALAVVACAVFVLAGILVLSGAGAGAGMAIAASSVSLLLVGLTFHLWFLAAIAIDVGIVAVALG